MAYQNFDEFFTWYASQIREQVPNFENMSSEQVHAGLKNLTGDQIQKVNKFIHSIIKLPKDIRLIYYPYDPVNKLYTFASNFDPYNKVFNIYYPTITWWMMEIPACVKEVIRHEMGHIYRCPEHLLYRSRRV